MILIYYPKQYVVTPFPKEWKFGRFRNIAMKKLDLICFIDNPLEEYIASVAEK